MPCNNIYMYVYRKAGDELSVCLKTKIPSCISKNKLKICICIWTPMTWPQAIESTLPCKIASRNCWETAQLSKMFCDDAPLTVQQFGHNMCHQRFLLHGLSLTCWKILPFLESIWFFSYDFQNIEHLITLVNSNAASRKSLIIIISLMVSPSPSWRARPWQ